MKQKYSPEQIVKFLREAEGKLASGQTVEAVCREIGVSDATYYNWRKTYGHLRVDQARRLKGRINMRSATRPFARIASDPTAQ